MALDLPPGRWTALLVGPWWPAPSTAMRGAGQYWRQLCLEQEEYSQGLTSLQNMLAANNQGHTADDLVARYRDGAKFHMDLAEKYQKKAEAFDSGADAIDFLRSRLTEIASKGDQDIDRILASKEPLPQQLTEILGVQARCNADSANASRDAINKIVGATQKILDAEGIGADARTWARDHGFNSDGASPPRPITADDLGTPINPPPRFGGGPVQEPPHAAAGVTPASPAAFGNGAGQAAPTGPAGGSSTPHFAGGGVQNTPSPVNGVQSPGGSPAIRGGAVPGAPLTNSSGQGLGGVMPASNLGQSASPNLAQSFASGMATGQPAGAGAQGISSGTVNAMESGAGTPPQAGPPAGAPPVTPTAPSAGVFIPQSTPADAPPPPAPAPSTTGTAPVAPVMTGGSWSGTPASVSGGPSVPAGPLPAYGSDLRPTVAAPSAAPSVPAGPVSGAPVAPSPGSSPSAGGPLVSPVERAAQNAAGGQAGASSSSMVGASAMSAATGATAGAVSSRAAEQQRLQRLVDAVARQEPRLSWAAGLRDDGTTTLLVTDLAGGWIPPHVRLPAHVTLLEPAARRPDANVVDLLGAVVVAAAHEHNTYVAESDPEAPALNGDRPARSAIPPIDEFGPALVEAVRRRDGLPRIAQAIAAPAVRKTGVLESEVELLRICIDDIQQSVLNVYPHHEVAAVEDWMLLSAIGAMIEGHEYLANYHLAWFVAIDRRGGV